MSTILLTISLVDQEVSVGSTRTVLDELIRIEADSRATTQEAEKCLIEGDRHRWGRSC